MNDESSESELTALHDTLIYRYRLGQPIDLDPDCLEHLWLQNKLWNALVEIDQQSRQRYRELLGSHADIEPKEQELAQLKDQQAQLREKRKTLRSTLRKLQDPQLVPLDEALRELAPRIQALSEQLRDSRRAVKEEFAAPLKALEQERRSRAETARKTSGLWYCNSNAVFEAYDRARVRAMREGTQLRFHGFRGEGRFTVQLIGGESISRVLSGQCSQVHLSLVPTEHSQHSLTVAIYSVDRHFRTVTFPVQYHRPLPPDATLQALTVTRHRIGTRFRHHVVFRMRVPAQPFAVHAYPERRCAINLGFRERPDGTLRVGMLINERGQFRELCLPRKILEIRDRLERLRGARDTHFTTIVARIRALWPERPHGASAELTERMTGFLRAPKPAIRKLAALIWWWRTDTAMLRYWPLLRDEIEAWRVADKKAYEREANELDQVLAHRRDYYRTLARELTREFGEIRLGKVNLRQMARLESPEGAKNELHARSRRNRQRAALYELQSEIKQQAVKSGSVLITVAPPYSSTCARCGEPLATGADLLVRCPQGHLWDQDELAATNIFAAERERWSAIEGPEERSQQRIQSLTRQRERLAVMAAARKAKRSKKAL